MGKPAIPAFAPLANTPMADALAGFTPAKTFDPSTIESPTPATPVANEEATPLPALASDSLPADTVADGHKEVVVEVVTVAQTEHATKVHIGKGPVRPVTQSAVETVAPLAHSEQVKRHDHDRRSARSQASRALVATEKVERRSESQVAPASQHSKLQSRHAPQPGDVYLQVFDLFNLEELELATRTRAVLATGGNPTFSFYFKSGKSRTALGMSVAPVGQSIRLTVEGGEGRLLEDFPVGTSFSLAEVREVFVIDDTHRANLVGNFRRELCYLMVEHIRHLSAKLTRYQGHGSYKGE